VNERDCVHAVLALLKSAPARDIAQPAHLHVDQTRDDLKIVLYPVVNLLEQHLLLTKRRLNLFPGADQFRLRGFQEALFSMKIV
jgi:hypothetical protein